MVKEEEPTSPATQVINALKILFAVSPLLVLGYVLLTGFDDKDEETAKRSKKTDFQLEGHDE
eukprot:CAMPEP_0197737536 /NCGR_PEP_ID=MMETSP1435-20131217/9566_1 /TAXON_ID=426625 /ORGANISM="Chaetoceros brevis, Strain CCMP164" /LENGTH=61 /DNA_ID=CAMNT_0043326087 /DNA_START=40 /DNA_END=225 /DNA_ORIENTATION=+